MCPVFSILAVIPAFAVFIVILHIYTSIEKKNIAAEIADLKYKYNLALQGKDKPSALAAGRLYYAALRADGKLTAFDEHTIAHDVAFI